MFNHIVRFFLNQPHAFQRYIHAPLDALSYTSNVLLVTAALGILGGVFVIAFAGDIASMSHTITSIGQIKTKYLSEKIDAISVDLTDTHVVITMTNFGEYPVKILGVLDGIGTELACSSNNTDSQNFVIGSKRLVEIKCGTVAPFDKDAVHYVVTETYQIIKVGA